MTTPDAGQRLIEDLRNPNMHFSWYDRLAAAKEIERLRGVEARMTRLVDAWTSNAGRSDNPVRRSIYQCCARDLSAALAATRTASAESAEENLKP